MIQIFHKNSRINLSKEQLYNIHLLIKENSLEEILKTLKVV